MPPDWNQYLGPSDLETVECPTCGRPAGMECSSMWGHDEVGPYYHRARFEALDWGPEDMDGLESADDAKAACEAWYAEWLQNAGLQVRR